MKRPGCGDSNASMPTVSVILPTYNQTRYLAQAIESVLRQTIDDWELVVMDDGSTDQTREVVAPYTRDPRIRYHVQSHQEGAAARNHGIRVSSGRYVAFLDADDVWLPEKLERQLRLLQAHPEAGLCYTLTRRIDAAGRVLDAAWPPGGYEGDVVAPLVRGSFIILSTVVVPRACGDRVGWFDESLPAFGAEDFDLWLRLARRYPVVCVREELILYRRHEGNTPPCQAVKSGIAVLRKHYADPAFAGRAQMGRRRALANFYLSAAGMQSGHIPWRFRAGLLVRGVLMCPLSGVRVVLR